MTIEHFHDLQVRQMTEINHSNYSPYRSSIMIATVIFYRNKLYFCGIVQIMVLEGIVVFILPFCFISYVSLRFIDYEEILGNANKCKRLYAYSDSKIFFCKNLVHSILYYLVDFNENYLQKKLVRYSIVV